LENEAVRLHCDLGKEEKGNLSQIGVCGEDPRSAKITESG
jgi:hypothetical protein